MNRGRGRRTTCAVLLVLWCAASWTLSSKSDPEGYVGVHLHLNDKVEHLIEYATGGVLAAGAFGSLLRFSPWAAAVVFCSLWGATDEIHQSFVPGRDASGMDLAADATGAALGALSLTLWRGRAQTPGREVDVSDELTSQRRRP